MPVLGLVLFDLRDDVHERVGPDLFLTLHSVGQQNGGDRQLGCLGHRLSQLLVHQGEIRLAIPADANRLAGIRGGEHVESRLAE